MSLQWYYVQKGQRQGPLSEAEFKDLFFQKKLGPQDYVWRAPFENWKKASEVEDLADVFLSSPLTQGLMVPPKQSFDFFSINPQQKLFFVRIGHDRGVEAQDYGPFSLEMIKKLFKEGRINGRTLIFITGMDAWTYLADAPVYEQWFGVKPPKIDDSERRAYSRKPFVARLFFHDGQKVYEGICRDISIGGLQVLVAGYPGKVGDKVALNIHSTQSQQSQETEVNFVASGKIVRFLEGREGMSLRFVDLTEEAKQVIETYIEENG